MSCDPERVTGFVDEALGPEARAVLAQHLEACPACREQAEAERALRAQLRQLPQASLPPGLEFSLRRKLRGSRGGHALRWLLPVAATLVLAVFWGRAFGPFVAWELALDHNHCWGKPQLAAKVFSNDPAVVAAFFEQRGTALPVLPDEAGGLELIGGRPCRLVDRGVAHLYYGNQEKRLSVFVIPGSVRIDRSLRAQRGRNTIALLRVGDSVVGLVSDDAASVEAFTRALSVSFARYER